MTFQYNTIVNALNQFCDQHEAILRFKASFLEQLDNFSTSGNSFPILYAVPQDVALETNIDVYSFRIYALDILQKDRANEAAILNNTLCILRDLCNWLRLDEYNNLNLLNTPRAQTVNNFLVDFTCGWYMDIEVEVPTITTDCSIPFSDNFILTGITCDMQYVNNYLTCESLTGCSTFQDYVSNAVNSASGTPQNLNSVLNAGPNTGGKNIVLDQNDSIKMGTSNAGITNISYIGDPNTVVLYTEPNLQNSMLLVRDGSNIWKDQAPNGFLSVQTNTNSIQMNENSQLINMFAGLGGINAYAASISLLAGAGNTVSYFNGYADYMVIGLDNNNSNTFEFYDAGQTLSNNGNNNSIIITDAITNKGLVYAADYSNLFSNESLITKRYVDNTVTGAVTAITQTALQNGLNTYTGGTAALPRINVSALTINTLSASGNTLFTAVTASTISIRTNGGYYGYDSAGTVRQLVTFSNDNIRMIGRPGISDIYLDPTSGSSIGMYIKGTDGSVGIGTGSPGSKLHVVGNGLFSSSTTTRIDLYSGAGVRTYVGADGSGSSFGSLTNHSVLFYSNNVERARFLTTGEFRVGSGSTTGQRNLRVTQDAALIDIGSFPAATSNAGIWLNKATPSATNFTLRDDAATNTFLNGGQVFLAVGGTSQLILDGSSLLVQSLNASTSGAKTNFTFTKPNNTNQTFGVAIPGWQYNGGSRNWSGANITNQIENNWGATTYTATLPSSISNAWGNYFNAPITGTNVSIGNNFAIGTTGGIQVNDGTIPGGIQLRTRTSDATAAAIYMSQTTPSANNYTLVSTTNTTVLNGPAITQMAVAGTAIVSLRGVTTGTANSWFVGQQLASTSLPASTEVNGVLWSNNSKTWLGGTLPLQREQYITSITYAGATATTIGSAFGFYVEQPTVGSNMTINKNYSAGFKGPVSITGGTGTLTGSGISAIGGTSLTIESNTTNYLSLLQPDSNFGGVVWGSPSDAFGAYIRYGYSVNNLELSTAAVGGKIIFNTSDSTQQAVLDSTGKFGLGLPTPTARLDITGSTTTVAPLRIRSGSIVSTPNDGDIYNDGLHLYARLSGVTKQLDSFSSGATVIGNAVTTSFTITHNLNYVPNQVLITPTSLLATAAFYVTNKTTTTFDINFVAAPGVGTVTFDWLIK